jgi:serine/threonine protein phosphatase PrpC/CRP-like cAMP-binding protein
MAAVHAVQPDVRAMATGGGGKPRLALSAWGQRRGATPAYTARDGSSSSTNADGVPHLDVKQGTWTPKGVAARVVWASVAQPGSAIDGSCKINQDACFASLPSEYGSSALFGVFDGHGVHGHLVAQQAAAQLPKLVQTELGRQADAREALIVAHLEQHRACMAALDCSQSGATAVTCRLAVDPQMSHLVCQTAWLGDARAVVGSVRPDGTLVAVELTTAHTPELLAERMRVEASGGVVAAMRLGELGEVGPLRVWSSAQVAPGLSMTRSLGDTNGAAVGVIAEAEVVERVLGPEDALLVLATDGLWEFLSPARVVAAVAERLRGQPITEEAVAATTQFVCEQARELWQVEDPYVDDISAVVLVLQQAGSSRRANLPVQPSAVSPAPSHCRASTTPASPATLPRAFAGDPVPFALGAVGTASPPPTTAAAAAAAGSSLARAQPPQQPHKRGGVSGGSAAAAAAAAAAVPTSPVNSPVKGPREHMSPETALCLRRVLCDPRYPFFGLAEPSVSAGSSSLSGSNTRDSSRGGTRSSSVSEAVAASDVAAALLPRLLERMTRRRLRRGEVLCAHGVAADAVYLVESGRLEATPPSSAVGTRSSSAGGGAISASPVRLSTARSASEGGGLVASYSVGDVVHELALLYVFEPTATVTCVAEEAVVWRLERAAFRAAVQHVRTESAAATLASLRGARAHDGARVLAALDDEELEALVPLARTVRLGARLDLLERAPPDGLYVVLAGALDLTPADGAPSRQLQPGDAFGEATLEVILDAEAPAEEDADASATEAAEPTTAVAAAAKSSCTMTSAAGARVTARTGGSGCTLLHVARATFLGRVGPLAEVRRLALVCGALAQVHAYRGFSAGERKQLARLMSTVEFAGGATIARAGGELSQLHVVVGGQVGVLGPGAQVVAHLGKGAVFGENALLRHEAAIATLVADGPVECLLLAKETATKQLGPLAPLLGREQGRRERRAHARSLTMARLQLGRLLGTGSFGVVRLATDASTGQTYALKSLSKARVLGANELNHTLDECRLLAVCSHPFVVGLVRTFEDPTRVHLLLEATLGGELFDALRAAPNSAFPERRCQFYAAMVVLALDYLHGQRIAYRDLKPENLLFDADGYLKLVDFGFARRIEPGARAWTLCGTPEYLAPEVLTGKGHGLAVDWWALGILLHEMLVGYPPFEGAEPLALYRAIVTHDLRYPKTMGANAQALLRQLLATAPLARLGNGKGGADDVKKHQFFKKMAWNAVLQKKIEAPYKPAAASAEAAGRGAADDEAAAYEASLHDEAALLALEEEPSVPPEAFAAFRELSAAFDRESDLEEAR